MSSEDSGTRLETITPEDHSADLWIVAAVCVAFSAVAIGARFSSKAVYHFKIQHDDYVMLSVFVLVVIQCALVMESLIFGTGKDVQLVPLDDVKPMMNWFIAGQAFYIASLYGVKTSLIFLISRLFQKSLRVYWISFIVLGVISIVAAAAGCTTFECSNNNPIPRWTVITIFDIITELIIILLPIFPLCAVRMDPVDKFKVMLSFSMRFLIIIFSILGIWAIGYGVTNPTGATNASSLPLTEPTTAIIIPTIFQQFELTLSVSHAAIMPCFRLLFRVCEDDDNLPAQIDNVQSLYCKGVGSKTSLFANFDRKMSARRNGSGKHFSADHRSDGTDAADALAATTLTAGSLETGDQLPRDAIPRLSWSSLPGSVNSKTEKVGYIV